MSLEDLLSYLGQARSPQKTDIVGNLPPEVASHILRFLNIHTLLSVILVSVHWRDLCLNDPVLRERVRNYVESAKRQKKENRKPDWRIKIVRYFLMKFKRCKEAVLKKRKFHEPACERKTKSMRF